MFDVRNIRNTQTDHVEKMQSYFCYTRYQAAYITQAAVTVIYNGLIQLPFAFWLQVDDLSSLCHCRYMMSLFSVLSSTYLIFIPIFFSLPTYCIDVVTHQLKT